MNIIELPVTDEPDYSYYSPHLDRFDVAIRAVWNLFRRGRMGGNWNLLNELGITREEHGFALDFADAFVEGLREDTQIAMLLTICPFVKEGALELLRRYGTNMAASKREYFKKEKVHEDVSYRVRNRPSHAKRA